MKDLSIIILSYNTRDITQKCLHALKDCLLKTKASAEIIMIDNGSADDSIVMLQAMEKEFGDTPVAYRLIINKENLGFTGGNNQGLKLAQGKYILYLNSDVIIENVDFDELFAYLDTHPDIGGLTVNVVLPSGHIDPASHRGFPTPWSSFSYFLKLDKIFKKVPGLNKVFGGYHLTYLDLNTIHEIDAPAAAFYLSRKELLDTLGGFDAQNFFAYGEDIDLTYRTKQLGYKILYYPKFKVIHYKRSSGLNNKSQEIRKKTQYHFNQAMKIFYKKHYEQKYPWVVNRLMYFFIDLKNKLS